MSAEKNIVISATANVSIPANAVINADGSITIGLQTFKDICITVSRYENGVCIDNNVLANASLTIEADRNMMNVDKSFQHIW